MKTNQIKQNSYSLSEIGLTKPQSEVYLALLELGHSTVLEISRHTKLNRITVHKTIEELSELGLVSSYLSGKRRKILAEPPEKLKNLIKIQKEDLDRKDGLLGDLINDLYKNINKIKDHTESEVKYYEGFKAVSELYDNILTYNSVRTIVNSHAVLKFFPGNVEKFMDAIRRGVEVYDLHTYGDASEAFKAFDEFKKTYTRYKRKSLPIEFKDIAAIDYLLYEGHIAMVLAGKRPKAIVIKNEFFYAFAVEMYKFIWRMC